LPETEEAEAERQSEERKGRQWKERSLTPFGISQIVNKDCLPRAEDSVITKLDTETKESGAGDCWMTCWKDRGEDRGERRGRRRRGRGGKACCTNTDAGGTVTKTHLSTRQCAAAATREPVTFVGRKYS
jgi:hypothetical protein